MDLRVFSENAIRFRHVVRKYTRNDYIMITDFFMYQMKLLVEV